MFLWIAHTSIASNSFRNLIFVPSIRSNSICRMRRMNGQMYGSEWTGKNGFMIRMFRIWAEQWVQWRGIFHCHSVIARDYITLVVWRDVYGIYGIESMRIDVCSCSNVNCGSNATFCIHPTHHILAKSNLSIFLCSKASVCIPFELQIPPLMHLLFHYYFCLARPHVRLCVLQELMSLQHLFVSFVSSEMRIHIWCMKIFYIILASLLVGIIYYYLYGSVTSSSSTERTHRLMRLQWQRQALQRTLSLPLTLLSLCRIGRWYFVVVLYIYVTFLGIMYLSLCVGITSTCLCIAANGKFCTFVVGECRLHFLQYFIRRLRRVSNGDIVSSFFDRCELERQHIHKEFIEFIGISSRSMLAQVFKTWHQTNEWNELILHFICAGKGRVWAQRLHVFHSFGSLLSSPAIAVAFCTKYILMFSHK